ncbi:enoyl-CoA hydratase/isomerase family protein [Streptomyces sp. NPDC094472]|uniref:enoyl-CoA hydratase/isomerase family protein n=1 Tax=Streptomyces sp. NPDC094472 TaxID=3155080 RepID=UPI0033174630
MTVTDTTPTASPDAGTVEIERTGEHHDIAVLTLRRERKLNALSTHLGTVLLDALRSQQVRTSRAVVVTGVPRAFSAGADTGELREMTPEAIADYYRSSGAVYETFAALPQPTVAALSGYCLGGGLELALAADIRVADPDTVFGLPEVGIGILLSSGGVTRLVREVGPARTRDLVLRGRRFGARGGVRLGADRRDRRRGHRAGEGGGDRRGACRAAAARRLGRQAGDHGGRRCSTRGGVAAGAARVRRAQPKRLNRSAATTTVRGDPQPHAQPRSRPGETVWQSAPPRRPTLDPGHPHRHAGGHRRGLHRARLQCQR